DFTDDVADDERPVSVASRGRLDQLQVVDDDQAEVGMLGFYFPCLGANVNDGHPALVDDVNGQVVKLIVDGLRLGELIVVQAGRVVHRRDLEAAVGTAKPKELTDDEPVADLLIVHFQTKNEYGNVP